MDGTEALGKTSKPCEVFNCDDEDADDCAVDGVLDSPLCPVNDLGTAEDLDSSCDVLVLGVEDETGVLDEITRVVGDEVAVSMAQLVFATVLTENTRGGEESVVDCVP